LARYGALWRFYRRLRRADVKKREAELAHWRSREAAEGTLGNEHYEMVFTGLVGLEPSFYAGKEILDLGCGPRGSLEWAGALAKRRVGLDPLAREYAELGTAAHTMEYVAADAEDMPFPDASFDVVTSFNSLDHVDDLDRTIAEIKRVVRPRGHLVIAGEIGHAPTWSEPQMLSWDLCSRFAPEFEVVEAHEYERGEDSIYESAWRRVAFDRSDPTPRPGVLTAVLARGPR
jgi:SAM-dependent methyltransferase